MDKEEKADLAFGICLRVLDIDLLQIHILHGRTPVEGETGDILPVSDLRYSQTRKKRDDIKFL